MSVMMPPGGLWIVGEYPSPNRLNRKTIHHLTAEEIDALTFKIPNMAVIATTTNANFTQDTLYFWKSDATGWISSAAGKHLHNADTDAAGGELSDIFYANSLGTYFGLMLASPVVTDFMQSPASTGASAANDFSGGRIVLTTGSTSGAYVHLGKSGVPVGMQRTQRFNFRGFVNAGSNLTARFGVGAETANLAAEVGQVRYGFEVCDSTGTLKQWDAFSGDGVGRSATVTTADVARSNMRWYRADYRPGISISYYENSTIILTKTTNVPAGTSTQATNGINNIGFGIKTNATNASKNMYCAGIILTAPGHQVHWYANP